MATKVVVLAGSPRKDGNTDLLVSSFVKGAERNHEVDVVSIHDYKINPCLGCNTCFERENNDCFQTDDMSLVYEKLGYANILVIASPVYFYGISSQLKAVIDRLHTPKRNQFHIKKLALILVGAAQLPELFDSIISQYKLILSFFHLEDAGTVLIRGARDKGVVTDKDLEKAYELGTSI